MNAGARDQAILLLTVSLGKSGTSGAKPLSAREWERFAIWLKDHDLEPSNLLEGDLKERLSDWKDRTITLSRLESLMDRGCALGLALEKWQRAGLWMITRADPEYPQKLKRRLSWQSPPVLFGCGNKQLLERGGIAVVGSRDADREDIAFTENLGARVADEGYSIVSGGARGVDERAMLGTLEKEGTAVGVLADGLLRAATSARFRKFLLADNLVLISPFNPEAGFNVGNAMSRNRYIYCLADAAVVISSTSEKGGTWNGAMEAIGAKWVPVWVKRPSSEKSGNAKLNSSGARWFPDDPVSLDSLLNDFPAGTTEDVQLGLPLPATSPASMDKPETASSSTIFSQGLRDFALEVFLSKWEFRARFHMTASDMESVTIGELLALASPRDREVFESLRLCYTETWGAPDLRAEIASCYESLKPENILTLAGAGEGLYTVARVLLAKGDHMIVPTPNYQSAESVPLSVCEVTGVPLRRDSDGGWHIEVDDIRTALRADTKLISINFPHNPTGMVLARNSLFELVALCRERGIWILSDEVYRGVELNPEDRMPQMADIYERGISLNVMSKAYGLPGLRLGWLACQDQQLLEKVERYKHYLSICNAGPSEVLGLIALKAREQILERNRQLVCDNVVMLEGLFARFPGLVEFRRPMGGCVSFPRYGGPGSVENFCRKLLEESGVLLLPASIYRSDLTKTPEEHFRIGFGRSTGFRDGIDAMQAHFEKHYAEFTGTAPAPVEDQ